LSLPFFSPPLLFFLLSLGLAALAQKRFSFASHSLYLFQMGAAAASELACTRWRLEAPTQNRRQCKREREREKEKERERVVYQHKQRHKQGHEAVDLDALEKQDRAGSGEGERERQGEREGEGEGEGERRGGHGLNTSLERLQALDIRTQEVASVAGSSSGRRRIVVFAAPSARSVCTCDDRAAEDQHKNNYHFPCPAAYRCVAVAASSATKPAACRWLQ
jgi:hypothetical protein